MTEFQIIDKIRMKTSLYIGHESPTHLNSFLFGYYFAQMSEGQGIESSNLHEFNDWVANKLGYAESTSGWAYMIEDQREDQQEALYLFYELLDEFRGITHHQIAHIKFNHEETTDRSWRGYSRKEKVRGSFKAIWKPAPKEIIIRKIVLAENSFQMVAKNKKQEILFTWNSLKLEKVFHRAKEIFGIKKEEWVIEREN